MQETVLTIPLERQSAVAAIRLLPGWEVALQEQTIWVKGLIQDSATNTAILRLPANGRYWLGEQQGLFKLGSVTPVAILPNLTWQLLTDFLPVTMPVAAYPGIAMIPADMQLLPARQQQSGGALLTQLNTFKQYVETVPATRLQVWLFAVNEQSQVWVMGTPLPAIPGKEYWNYQGIWLPAGYELASPLMVQFLHATYNPAQDKIIVVDENANLQTIDTIYLVPATRSAVRLTNVPVSTRLPNA